MLGLRNIFSLRWTVVFSVAVKFTIFLVGIAIIGITSTRTELASCGSSVTGFPVFTSPFGNLEAYTDYRDLYLKCLVNPFLAGKSAYNLPIVYNYPPLFLYTLAAFALDTLAWSPALALVSFDALTVIPIYLIARDYLLSGNNKAAFAVAMIWVFNPINLFYNDLMWLNPGPTTFFLMLGIYLFLKQRWGLSAIVLAISTGFKQTAVILFPILVMLMWKTIGFTKKSIAFITLYVSSLVVISTPYIFNDTQSYLWALQIPILGNPPGAGPSAPTTFLYDLSQPTRLTTFFGLIKFVNLQSFAVATYSYLNYIFIACYVVLVLHLYFTKRKLTNNDYLLYVLTGLLLFFTFFGRGVYKYYFAGITPLALPFFSSKRRAIIFEAFSLILLFIPREVTPWMALLLITFVPSLIQGQIPEPSRDFLDSINC
ncbi:MAG: hypothetical protein JRN67_04845 [Nitrososphaerota archaeon]|nr:hypothetical protein [Nitrososphaerota archaeon]